MSREKEKQEIEKWIKNLEGQGDAGMQLALRLREIAELCNWEINKTCQTIIAMLSEEIKREQARVVKQEEDNRRLKCIRNEVTGYGYVQEKTNYLLPEDMDR